MPRAAGKPPGRICPIEGGTITTEPLTALSGPEHKVTFKPEGGEPFTGFTILHEGEQCTTLPETEVAIGGEVIGIASEAVPSHLTFTPETNGNGLKANGATAHYEGTEVGYMAGTEQTVGLEGVEEEEHPSKN